MELLQILEGIRTPLFDGFFSIITYLGEQTVFLIAVMIMLWCVDKKWGYRLCIIGIVGNTLNQLLKAIFTIPRPWVIDKDFTIVEAARDAATGYSFPSGHTQSVTSLFLALSGYLKKRWFWVLSIVLILLTAFSRMYLGVHTPLDVGVSLITGVLTVFALNAAFEAAGDDNRKIARIGLCSLAFSAVLVLYVLFAPKTEANVAEFDGHGIKAAVTMFATMLAIAISWVIDEKHTKFSVKAVWWVQILKFVLGVGIAFAIKSGLKPVLISLIGNAYAADALRYFLMTMFAGTVWPMTFKWWAKLGNKDKLGRQHEKEAI